MDGYNYDAFGQCEVGVPDFWEVVRVGETAPEFSLTDLDGRRVSLSDFKGKKHVVLEFGSIT